VSGGARGTPALAADGTVYVIAGEGTLCAVGPDGTVSWQYDVGGLIRSDIMLGPDGTVYVNVGGSGLDGVYASTSRPGWPTRRGPCTSTTHSAPAVRSHAVDYFPPARRSTSLRSDQYRLCHREETATGGRRDTNPDLSEPAVHCRL